MYSMRTKLETYRSILVKSNKKRYQVTLGAVIKEVENPDLSLLSQLHV